MRALFIALLLTATVHGQAVYDAALAARLKADDNGMKTYVMAFLKATSTGWPPRGSWCSPARSPTTATCAASTSST